MPIMPFDSKHMFPRSLLMPFILGVSIFALTPAPTRSAAIDSPGQPNTRVIVQLNTTPSDAIRAELETLGKVHGWIDRFQIVAMTPTPHDLQVIASLPYVVSLQPDDEVELLSVGSWDKDIIDVVDVEESGAVGNPDPREVAETGSGVHIALIDTGLGSDWRDVLGEDKVDVALARSFVEGTRLANGRTVGPEFPNPLPGNLWEHDFCLHGTGVAAPITGFKIGDTRVEGVAPGAKLIPLKVSGNGCLAFWEGGHTDRSGLNISRILAALDYLIGLKEQHIIGPTILSLSIAIGRRPLVETAINAVLSSGIIVVAAAGNSGEQGMPFLASYPQVISVGAVGWTKEFRPGTLASPNLDFWWTQDVGFDPDPVSGPNESSEAYVATYSSRAIPSLGQELDLLAPADNIVLPHHVPGKTFFDFAGGTSFAAPVVAGVAALMLEKNPSLTEAHVESILKATALPMSPVDTREGLLHQNVFSGELVERSISWDDDCAGVPCDPVGAGIVQADAALAATPRPTGL
jgi:subtilisin family serine protease